MIQIPNELMKRLLETLDEVIEVIDYLDQGDAGDVSWIQNKLRSIKYEIEESSTEA